MPRSNSKLSAHAVPGSRQRSSVWRPDDDHYPTPAEAIWPFLRSHPFPNGALWECACGDGAMVRVMESCGYDVVATNLKDRGFGETGINFLTTKKLRAPYIVTNPPFSLAQEFALHAISLGATEIALLARTKFVEGADRYRMLHSRFPPAYIYQFIERITFFAGDTPVADQPGWSSEAFAWFVWQRGNYVEPKLRWLSRDDGRQPSFLDE